MIREDSLVTFWGRRGEKRSPQGPIATYSLSAGELFHSTWNGMATAAHAQDDQALRC